MSASSTRIAVAAASVLLLAMAGGLAWQRMKPFSSAHVEMLASPSSSTPGMPEGTATPQRRAAALDVKGERESAPQPALRSGSDTAQTKPAAPPAFDIVRVEPSGEALLAGHGKPDSTVTLVDRGKVVAEAKADSGGNFVMTPPALKPGDYALSLREGQGAAVQESKQSVVVSVPASKKQQVVVALAEPGKATTLLSAPPEPAPATKARASDQKTAAEATISPPKLAIRSVELENGTGVFASGIAPPGTDVRVYLNDSRIADVIAAAAGAWSVNVRKGLTAGRYAVRADSLKPDQSVAARVEVPFEVPPSAPASIQQTGEAATSAETVHTALKAPDPSHSSKADAVVDELKTELVTRGDNLWHISRKRLGHGTRYTEIYAANATQIRDPKLVYPGQVFVLPRD